MSTNIYDEYFEWLFNLVCGQRYFRPIYRKLLMRLHDTEFVYLIPRDKNRAEDGEELRYRFAISKNYDIPTTLSDLGRPCSVLEMMTALAIRCEEQIADDPRYGDRTGQWFWKMVVNLGLGPMTDEMFDRDHVDCVLQTFLERRYKPNGEGGLFYIRNCDDDLRRVEIWHQLCWYLDTIL